MRSARPIGAAFAALGVAACGSGGDAPAAIDPALRTAVDAATSAYYQCIDAAARTAAPAEAPVASIVVAAERSCEAARSSLADAIVALRRAEKPGTPEDELQQTANNSILAYSPRIRERVAAARVAENLAATSKAQSENQETDASN